MNRKKYALTRRAKADLIEIWRYVAEYNVQTADRLIDRLMASFQLLAEHPGISLPLGESRKGVRYWPANEYVVLVRAASARTEIIRVVHGSRDRGGIDLQDLED